jgi:hypothetical protein
MSNDAINADIRRRAGRGHIPPPPRPDLDPDTAARIRDYLEAAGERVPDYLRPKPPSDWGGGPRGRPVRDTPDDFMNQVIRRQREIYP